MPKNLLLRIAEESEYHAKIHQNKNIKPVNLDETKILNNVCKNQSKVRELCFSLDTCKNHKLFITQHTRNILDC